MIVPMGLMLNYIVSGLAGVTTDYILLSSAFKRRGAPVLWCVYFLVKTVVDAHFWYLRDMSLLPAELAAFHNLWLSVCGIVSFAVVCRTFKGEYVSLCACALVCDMLAAVLNVLMTFVGNALVGDVSLHTAYYTPTGLHTLLTVALIGAACLVLRPVTASLLRLICRITMLHRNVWALAAVLIMTMFVKTSQYSTNYFNLSNHLSYMTPAALIVCSCMLVLILRQSNIVQRRREALEECQRLSMSYDAAIRGELAALDRDRAVLDGHEQTLGRLRRGADDALSGRIDELRREYRRISFGAYCDRPALDAVLAAGVQRLREAGAKTTVTVAGVAEQTPVPVTAVLTLVNLACEAAGRSSDVQGEDVELRIRGIGQQVLLRLDVPARFGALWARRYLSAFDESAAMLVSERRVGERRVVLVLCGEVAA